MAATTSAFGARPTHKKMSRFYLLLVVLGLGVFLVPARGDDGFDPVRSSKKAYVADADLALIAEQATQENLKEMTKLETVARVFSELPRNIAFRQQPDVVPEAHEDDPHFQDASLQTIWTKTDSLSGRISLSDIRTAVVEESIPGDSGEQFLEEVFALFKGRGSRKLPTIKGGSLTRVSRGGRKLLADSEAAETSTGNGVTLNRSPPTTTSDSDSGNWGPLSKGAWIGVIIAIVFVVGALSILCWCLECICCCCCF